jgi:Leucine-rich repeat (LRR) protein
LGIVETAHVADASLVYLRVCVLSANLIILPLATVCEWMIWGRIAGTAAIYFVEVIFDRLFVLVAVYQQATSNELLVNSSGSIMSHLSSHLPSLMPAVIFIIVQSPAFVTLAETADNRRTIRQHRRHAIAAGKGVRWACFREMQEHYSAILIQRWARHRLVVIKRQRAQKKTCFWQRGCPKVRASYIFCAILVVFFTLGVSIFMYVNYAISGQEDICEAQIGPVARCVWPKMYFEDSGFFGETGCHFERVKSIECFSGRLRLGRMDRVSTLPEAPEIYETMTELRKINLTGCPLLESVPSSWSRIPHLTSIDVSQNKMLRTFPVQLCVNASSKLRDKGSISVAGTVASKTLNWTGQFMPWASDNSPSLPAMSEACLSAFQDSVTVLDLSHNNLSTGKIINGLEWITDWGNLKRINFGHNRIDRLDKELVDLTRRVHIHSGSIGLAANPVKNVNLVNSDIEQIAGVLNDLKDSYLPSSTLLKKVEIVGIANGYLLDIFSGLRHNSLFNEAKFGVRELVLEFVELDEGLEFAEGGDLFEGMANLKSLTIRRSRIGAVGKETFASLQNLNKLELVANDLANVEVGTFAGLPNLEHLILGKDLEHIVKRRDWGLSDTVKVEFVAHSASALSASNLL